MKYRKEIDFSNKLLAKDGRVVVKADGLWEGVFVCENIEEVVDAILYAPRNMNAGR